MSEEVSKTIIGSYGIPVTRPFVAMYAEKAVKIANTIGFPVVMKVHSPDITHKSDIGGVLLNLNDDRQVRNAFDKIEANVRLRMPEARFDKQKLHETIKQNAACTG